MPDAFVVPVGSDLTAVSGVARRLLVRLHELGHLTRVNVHPGVDGDEFLEPEEVSQAFNTQIYLNCLSQGARYQ